MCVHNLWGLLKTLISYIRHMGVHGKDMTNNLFIGCMIRLDKKFMTILQGTKQKQITITKKAICKIGGLV